MLLYMMHGTVLSFGFMLIGCVGDSIDWRCDRVLLIADVTGCRLPVLPVATECYFSDGTTKNTVHI
jgi:hypothetical protein